MALTEIIDLFENFTFSIFIITYFINAGYYNFDLNV